MRRFFVIGLATVSVGVGVFASLGAGDVKGEKYKIVFDSAFGLVKGADFKVGGVAVGTISELDVTEDARALVSVEVTKRGDGFAGLRETASCTVNPQSLIGEYFVDCQPGETGELLPMGATVPVDKTTSPIPPDLVLNIMRRPIAERFRLVFGELGIGFAARGEDVNETLRRALPALQSTEQVLELLARKRRTLRSLSRESGRVLSVLGRRREDVGDFVTATGDAAAATAERREAVAETFRRFPGFLDELEPTMVDLGTASRQMAPALADLRAAAPSVTSLLNTLRPFAQASLPAVESLGDASESGRTASREAASLIDNLGDLGVVSAEPANNLRIILEHLDDREFAVDPDPDSPTGAGYTGLEAPLQYVFDQSLALNMFDQRGYTLKLNLSAGECGAYTTAASANSDRARYDRCNQNLGPNQPGITTPDESASEVSRSTRRGRGDRRRERRERQDPGSDTTAPTTTPAPGAAPAPTAIPKPPLGLKPLQDLVDQVNNALPPPVRETVPTDDLLDFLLG